jgi:hypothetical protein
MSEVKHLPKWRKFNEVFPYPAVIIISLVLSGVYWLVDLSNKKITESHLLLTGLCNEMMLSDEQCQRAWRLYYNEHTGKYSGLSKIDVIEIAKMTK